jgi:gliding motility-associated-like protein
MHPATIGQVFPPKLTIKNLNHFPLQRFLILIIFSLFASLQAAAQLSVTSRNPARNSLNAQTNTVGNIVLKIAGGTPTVSGNRLFVFSSQFGGLKTGSTTYRNVTEDLSFAVGLLKPGEKISVTLPAKIIGNAAKEVYQFTAGTGNFGAGRFVPNATVQVGSQPNAAAVGDIDQDGDQDLITSNLMTSSLSLRLNNGNGTFTGVQEIATPQATKMLVLGDIDGDGDLDLLATNAGFTGTVTVRKNNGAGIFTAAADISVGNSPYGINVGDIDADGDLDLLTANVDGNTVSVRFNNGVGVFSGSQEIAIDSPQQITMADIDNDGDLDFLTTQFQSNVVHIGKNDGEGNFSPSSSVTVGNSPSGIAVGDIDGDGDIDLITSNAVDNSVSVRTNLGNGTFGGNLDLSVGTKPTAIAMGDVDGDGDFDFVVTSFDTNTFSVWKNAQGTFTQFAAPILVGAGPSSITLAELNADGGLDLVVTHQNANNVGVLLSKAISPSIISTSPTSNAINVAQINNIEATLDQEITNNTLTRAAFKVFSPTAGLISTTSATTALNNKLTFTTPKTGSKYWYGQTIQATITNGVNTRNSPLLNPKVFKFTTATETSDGTFDIGQSATTAIGPVSVAVGYFNNQTYVASASLGSNSVSLHSYGLQHFESLTSIAIGQPSKSVHFADVDGDGDPDLLTANTSTVSVKMNNGNGQFNAGNNYAEPALPNGLMTGDLDADGDLDVVIALADGIAVRFNNGAGIFGNETFALSSASIKNVLLFDLDNDGDLDLIANGQNKLLYVLFNDGTGSFSEVASYPAENGALAAGDINKDGAVDLMVCGQGIGSTLLFKNNGTGVFTSSTVANSPPNLIGLMLGDVDGDGDLDLFGSTNATTKALQILFNNGTSTFGLPIGYGDGGNAMVLEDLDGDGTLDVIMGDATGTGTSIYVLYNRPPAPKITSTSPVTNAVNVSRSTNVSADFDQTIWFPPGGSNLNYDNMLWVFSAQSGGRLNSTTSAKPRATTTYTSLSGTGGARLTLNPTVDFKAGEVVQAIVSNYQSINGNIKQPKAFQFVASVTGPGRGIFDTGSVVTVGSTKKVAIGDIDGDGDLDMVTANETDNLVTTKLNDGNAAFVAGANYAVGTKPQNVTLADMDGDGDLDILTANYTSNNVSLRLNNGSGTYTGTTQYAVGSQPILALATLLNADGVPDIVTVNQSGSISILLSVNGSFGQKTDYQIAPNLSGMAIADVDNDGDFDIVTANSADNKAMVSLNNGLGTFAAAIAYQLAPEINAIAMGDLNGDGFTDLAAINQQNVLIISLNNGTGGFSNPVTYPIGTQPQGLSLNDLDSDGDLDVLIANMGSNNVSLRFNNGNGTFSGGSEFAVNDAPLALATGDLDNDGDIDMVTVHTSGIATVRLNTKPLSANADLANLSVGYATSNLPDAVNWLKVTPNFDPAVEQYTFATKAAKITVYPALSDPESTVTITLNNQVVTSEPYKSAFTLVNGNNIFKIAVTSSNGTIKNYQLTVLKGSSALGIKGIEISSGPLSPDFSPAITAYSATMHYTVASINVKPIMERSDNAVAQVNGQIVPFDNMANVPLAVGPNTISVTSTSENGAVSQTYTLTITRSAPEYGYLQNIETSVGEMSPNFSLNPGLTASSMTVANETSAITLTPTVIAGTDAIVSINGVIIPSGTPSPLLPLAVGLNTITVLTTAANGFFNSTFILTVTRKASPNAALASLSTTAGTLNPVFAPETLSYNVSVNETVSSISFTPTAVEQNAVIEVNGVRINSGSPSAQIPLALGQTTYVRIRVLSPNLDYVNNYVIAVSRAPSTDPSFANLISLSLNAGLLSPAFSQQNDAYATLVENGVSNIKVYATPASVGAAILVNGIPIGSSTPIALTVGVNTIEVKVTSANGMVTKTYQIEVTREALLNSNLKNLVTSDGNLSPSFSSQTTAYTVTTEDNQISFTPTSVDPNALIQMNGTMITSGATETIPLTTGLNEVNIVVKGQDAAEKTYVISVTRLLNGNADLSGLTTNLGAVEPNFSALVTNYELAVENSPTSISILPTARDPNAKIYINDVAVNAGSSAIIPLAVGTNMIRTRVVAPNGTATKTYNITVTRAASPNADLSAINLVNGVLSPLFSPATTTYTATFVHGTNVFIFTPVVSDAAATLRVNGSDAISGEPIQIGVGNTRTANITIEVTAPDRIVKKEYQIVATVAPSSNADLHILALSPGVSLTPVVSAASLFYTATVPNATAKVGLNYLTAEVDASVALNANGVNIFPNSDGTPIDLQVGANVITLTITAEDGVTKKVYTVTITRLASANSDLASLTVNDAAIAPAFNPATIAYSATVPGSTASLKLTPTASDQYATITINGTPVVSGTASAAIPLVFGGNVISTVVTAQNGSSKTYVLHVTRSKSVNADLLTLTLSNGTLVPSFNPQTTIYTTTVANAVESLSVTPTKSDSYANLKVNGAEVDSGTDSQPIPLSLGSNTISITVTAQNGNTKTYTVTVYRAGKPQVITFAPLAIKTYGSADFDPGAVSDNQSIPLTYESDNHAVATIVNGKVHLVGAGTTNITALQFGNDSFETASVSQSLTITKRVLTVTADDKTKVAGTQNPTFTIQYQGFANGENSSVLASPPLANTAATTASPVGIYPIIASGGIATNYTFDYKNGWLTIVQPAPSDIILSAQTLNENTATGSTIGELTSISTDPNATFSYSLVAGTGANDNAAFSIVGNELRNAQVFNYEARATYTVRIKTETTGLQSHEKVFVITVGDVNEAPTLAAIADITVCTNTLTQTLQLFGITAGPEATQQVAATVSTTNDNIFDLLTVGAVDNGNAILTYRLKNNAIGTATVTITITDNGGTANGGTNVFSRSFSLNSTALPQLSIASNSGTTINKGSTITLTASGATTYTWANATGIISGQNSAELTIRPSVSTTYTVTGTNAAGCSTSQTISIVVVDDYNLQISNVLTPNGDGVNDKLMITNIDLYPVNLIKIFDRAGRLLYTKRNYQNEWDGIVNGTPLTEGTYYYTLEINNGKSTKKGFITVLRNK